MTGGFVHVDVREASSRWISKSGTAYHVVSKIMPTIRQGSKTALVARLMLSLCCSDILA